MTALLARLVALVLRPLIAALTAWDDAQAQAIEEDE